MQQFQLGTDVKFPSSKPHEQLHTRLTQSPYTFREPFGHEAHILNSKHSALKHRRIKANGRERERMRALNQALEILRNKLPNVSNDVRLSKIGILKLANQYINSLVHLLNSSDPYESPRHDQISTPCASLSNIFERNASPDEIHPTYWNFLAFSNSDSDLDPRKMSLKIEEET